MAFTFACFISRKSRSVSSIVTLAPPVGLNSCRFTPFSLIFSSFIKYIPSRIPTVRKPIRCRIFSPSANKTTSYNSGFSALHFFTFSVINSICPSGKTSLTVLKNLTEKGISLKLVTMSIPSLFLIFVSILKSLIWRGGRTNKYTLRNIPEKRNLS